MTARGLIDTGAILALLDRDDRCHHRCVNALRELRLPLATSAAVLAELFHGEMEIGRVEGALIQLAADLEALKLRWALIGGLAVSARTAPQGRRSDQPLPLAQEPSRPPRPGEKTGVHLGSGL